MVKIAIEYTVLAYIDMQVVAYKVAGRMLCRLPVADVLLRAMPHKNRYKC